MLNKKATHKMFHFLYEIMAYKTVLLANITKIFITNFYFCASKREE